MKFNIFNKITLAFLCLISIFTLASCDKLVVTEEGNVEAEETEYKNELLYESEAFSYEVLSVDAFGMDARTFLIVEMEYNNFAEDEVDLDLIDFDLFFDNEEADSIRYSDLSRTQGWNSWNPLDSVLDTRLLYSDSTVQSGRTERGYLVYEYTHSFSELEFCLYGGSIVIPTDMIQVLNISTPSPTPMPGLMLETEVSETTPAETTTIPETTPTPETTPAETEPTETTPAETTPAETVPAEAEQEEG